MSSTPLNGTGKQPRAVPSSLGGRDPMARVYTLGLGIPVVVMMFAAMLAVTLHAGAAVGAAQAAAFHAFGWWAHDVRAAVASRLAQTYEFDLVKPSQPEKEKPEDPPPELPKEEPKVLVKAQKDDPPPPPPAAADAAKVLMQEPAKDEPVDLTGNTFLNGNAETAVGGTTQIGGTGRSPTNSPAAVATGVQGGTGTVAAPQAPKVDRSRAVKITNVSNLERCPFPAEADAEQIDEAVVGISVSVTPEGRPASVTITSDPGHGFAREARKCALREAYTPALNVDGNPMPGTYAVRFRFTR